MNYDFESTDKFIYRETPIYEFDEFDNEIGEIRVYTIAIVNQFGLELPHPLTDFLRDYRSSTMSLERERQVASTVCEFMNFTRKMVVIGDEDFNNLKTEGIYGLNFLHGSRFLQYADEQKNNRGQPVRKNTVDRKQKVLINFYVFFQKHGVINEDLSIPSYPDKEGNLKYVNPFLRKRGKRSNSNNPKRKDLRDFGEFRQKILIEFIETALSMKTCKGIAFGLALQGFGGLRRGEIVNLTTGSISKSGKSLVVNVKDRQDHLFPNKKNTRKEEVKKPRMQDVLPSQYILDLQKKHEKWLDSQREKHKFFVKDALFVNNSGYPMSGKTYEKKFKKVVKEFLKRLLSQKRFDDHSYLTAKPFNTHTLRGVFTNILLDDLDMEQRQVANMRGDNWDTSLKDYVEALTGRQKMDKALEQLANAVIDAQGFAELEKKLSSEDKKS
jgi:integrase